MFPFKPDDLGVMPPIPAVATISASSGDPTGHSGLTIAEVKQRCAEFIDDLQPTGVVARFLARRAAMLSLRLERLARYDAAAVAVRVRRAEAEYVQNRMAEIDHLHSWIAAEPAVYARRLRQSPEGIDRLIKSWQGLRYEITDPDFPRWGADHRMLAENLSGRRSNELPVSPIQLYSEAYIGFKSGLVEATPEFAGLTPARRQILAAEKLIAIIDAAIAALRVERDAIDLEALDRDRLEATDRALFDPSPAATLARRYEQATERGLHRALRTIDELEILPEPEPGLEPEDVVEAAPDPTTITHPYVSMIGKRSRRHVAFRRAARKVTARRDDFFAAETEIMRAEDFEPRMEHGSNPDRTRL